MNVDAGNFRDLVAEINFCLIDILGMNVEEAMFTLNSLFDFFCNKIKDTEMLTESRSHSNSTIMSC